MLTNKQFQQWKRNGNFTSSLERILTVSNHISEGEHDCYTKKEAAECATYHNLDAYYLQAEIENLKGEGMLKYLRDLMKKSKPAKRKAP